MAAIPAAGSRQRVAIALAPLICVSLCDCIFCASEGGKKPASNFALNFCLDKKAIFLIIAAPLSLTPTKQPHRDSIQPGSDASSDAEPEPAVAPSPQQTPSISGPASVRPQHLPAGYSGALPALHNTHGALVWRQSSETLAALLGLTDVGRAADEPTELSSGGMSPDTVERLLYDPSSGRPPLHRSLPSLQHTADAKAPSGLPWLLLFYFFRIYT